MRHLTLKLALLMTVMALGVSLAACGDDDDKKTQDTTTADVTDDGSEDTTATDTTATDTTTEDTATADTTTTEDTTGDVDTYVPTEWAVLVLGDLADFATAQASHDGLAAAGEADAKAAGDIAHDVLLGTTILGTTENQFMAQDRWTDVTGMTTFYTDPDFAAAFGALFSAQPSVSMWAKRSDWHTWGDMTSGDSATTYYFVVARGRLLSNDMVAMKAVHDAIASGGEADATAAGDVAHTVWVGLGDPQEFLAIDIWNDSTNIEAFYSDPLFQAAFGALLEAPPTIGVYQSTTWHQW